MSMAKIYDDGKTTVQKAFSGAAEVLGVKDEDDVQALISELRHRKN